MSHFAPQRRSTRTATFSATLAAAAIALTAVSYTHLTLPTILRV